MERLRLLIMAALLAIAASPSPVCAQLISPFADLQSRLAVMAGHAPGEVGVEVLSLESGRGGSFNAALNMPAASTIKIPVMVEVFRQMALGRLTLNRVVHLRSGDRDWGWGDLSDAPAGTGYTVKTLLRVMITESDNTATNMLIRLVGRRNINATMARLGLHDTVVGDYIRSDGDIRSLRSSPSDMATLVREIALERVVDPWSSREMIAIMSGQRHNSLIPQPLPRGIIIAHKTGTLHDTLNDVGIVFLNSQPYVIAVMATRLPDLDAGRRFIRSVSRLAYETFAKLSHARPLGEDLSVTSVPSALDAQRDDPAEDVRMWTPQDRHALFSR